MRAAMDEQHKQLSVAIEGIKASDAEVAVTVQELVWRLGKAERR
jgi:hypothetical protein